MSEIELLDNPELSRLLTFICDSDEYFTPRLSERINLQDYTKKLSEHAVILYNEFDGEIVSLIAGYTNNKKAYITYLFVLPEFRNKKLAKNILQGFIGRCVNNDSIELTVNKNNPAFYLYENNGFVVKEQFTYQNSLQDGLIMELIL